MTTMREARSELKRNAIDNPIFRITGTAASIFGSALWAAAAAALTRAIRRRRTITELSRLDDRMLEDIGLRRDEIPGLALRNTRQTPARGPLGITVLAAVRDRLRRRVATIQ